MFDLLILARQWTTRWMLTGATVLALLAGAPVGAQDYETIRRSAEQGDAEAQFNLGVMYVNGRGVPRDYVSAQMWLILAAANGAENAREALGKVAAALTPEQIAEAEARAREWSSR